MDDKQKAAEYRARIKQMLKRVPSKVNAGSYDQAVAFKKLAGTADKLASSNKASLAALTSMHNQLTQYYT